MLMPRVKLFKRFLLIGGRRFGKTRVVRAIPIQAYPPLTKAEIDERAAVADTHRAAYEYRRDQILGDWG
jgi:hypothetical protein